MTPSARRSTARPVSRARFSATPALPERLGDLRVDARRSRRPGAPAARAARGRGLALRARLALTNVLSSSPAALVRCCTGRAGREQRGADVVVDVVQGVAAFGVAAPTPPATRRTAGARRGPPASRARPRPRALCAVTVGSKPRPSMALAAGVKARTRSARLISTRDRWNEAEHQAQIGQPARSNGLARPGREDRRLGGVQRVEPADQPDLTGRRDQRVAEQVAEVPGHLVGPAQHLLEDARPGPGGGDQVAGEHQPHRVLVGAEVAGRDGRGGRAGLTPSAPPGTRDELEREAGQVQHAVRGPDRAARRARHQPHRQHVVAAGPRRPAGRRRPCGPRWPG